MLKTAIAIRHIAFEDLGFFETPLRDAGYAIRYHEAQETDFGALDEEAALVIVLGGPMGVYEEHAYLWLAGEIRFLERRLAANRPTLGICLGSQLIARALGAQVYPGHGKEIGFGPITLSEAGKISPLAAVAPGQPVLHWHGDTFDLPAGAALLASSEAYPHQAFSVGPNIFALQFHLEAGAEIDRWLTGHAEELRAGQIDTARLRQDALLQAPALSGVSAAALTAWLDGIEA